MSATISDASLLLDGTAGYVDLYPPPGYLNELRKGKFAIVMVLQPTNDAANARYWSAEGNSGPDLLTDGNFESGTEDNWNDYGSPSETILQTSINHVARTSKYTMKLTGTDAGDGIITTPAVTTTTGEKYRLRAAFERRDIDTGVTDGLDYVVLEGDGSGNALSATKTLSVLNRFDIVNHEYTEASGGSSATVRISINTGHANDVYYIDDVSLRKTLDSPRFNDTGSANQLDLYWEATGGDVTLSYTGVTDAEAAIITATFDPSSGNAYGSVDAVANCSDTSWTEPLLLADLMKIRLGAEAGTATNYAACNWVFFALLNLTPANPTIDATWDADLNALIYGEARSNNYSRAQMRSSILSHDSGIVGYYWTFSEPGTSGAFDSQQLSIYNISDGTEYSVTAPVS